MKGDKDFDITRYNFDAQFLNALSEYHYAQELWPIVYLLNNQAEKIPSAYVGETTDTQSRFTNHLHLSEKQKLK